MESFEWIVSPEQLKKNQIKQEKLRKERLEDIRWEKEEKTAERVAFFSLGISFVVIVIEIMKFFA